LGSLFNGKINPLIPYAIKGAIWYQGEANSQPLRVSRYVHQLPTLIQDWRARWGSDFPFAWVQLPNFEGGAGRDWPLLREAQLETLKLKNTGMVIAIDLGEAANIHPLNKPAVGRRLGLWALSQVYGQQGEYTGPLPAGHEVKGDRIIVKFTHADGLTAKDGAVKGFLIAGEDHRWKPGVAVIDDQAVTVSSPEVKQPAAIRYAWANFPDGNLYNSAGLPASPFRTDAWNDPLP
jgi:sialate O-acetylesterase